MKPTTKKRSARMGIIALAGIALLTVPAYLGFAQSAARPVDAPKTAVVKVGTIRSSVPAEGRLDVRRSERQPTLGVLRWRWQLFNQDRAAVLELVATNFFDLGPSDA